ncbi:MAG: hypothetical protein AABX97_02055 [Candidatus Thermoplasmatota archaeon]
MRSYPSRKKTCNEVNTRVTNSTPWFLPGLSTSRRSTFHGR